MNTTKKTYERIIERNPEMNENDPEEIMSMIKEKEKGYQKLILRAYLYKYKKTHTLDETIKKYREMIHKLMNEIKEKEKSHKNRFAKIALKEIEIKENDYTIRNVITGLYTLIPPRRLEDYSLMRYVKKREEIGEKEYNYYIEKEGIFYFQVYKTVKTYKIQEIKVDENCQVLVYVPVLKELSELDLAVKISEEEDKYKEIYSKYENIMEVLVLPKIVESLVGEMVVIQVVRFPGSVKLKTEKPEQPKKKNVVRKNNNIVSIFSDGMENLENYGNMFKVVDGIYYDVNETGCLIITNVSDIGDCDLPSFISSLSAIFGDGNVNYMPENDAIVIENKSLTDDRISDLKNLLSANSNKQTYKSSFVDQDTGFERERYDDGDDCIPDGRYR